MFWRKVPTHLHLLAKTSGIAPFTKLHRGFKINLELSEFFYNLQILKNFLESSLPEGK